MGNPTHQKIARLANVSLSTVSKALSGSREISEETARMVRLAALQCGYFDEKRRRRKELSQTVPCVVSVLVPEIDSTEYSRTAELLYHELEKHNVAMNLHIIGFDCAEEFRIIEKLEIDSFTDGIIHCGANNFPRKPSVPMVCLTKPYNGVEVDSVYSDTADAFRTAVEFYRRQNYSEIAFIGEKNTVAKNQDFLKVMKEAGYSEEATTIYTIEKRFEEVGREAVRLMIQKGHVPPAIITAYDEIAVGAMEELRKQGISIPEQSAIIGYNNSKYATLTDISLSSIDPFDEKKCTAAVNLLMERIENPEDKLVQTIKVQSKLVLRRTTRPDTKFQLIEEDVES